MAIQVKEGEALWVQQDKNARTSYKFDLSPLMADGDTLSSVTWEPGAGVTVDGSFSGSEAAAWVSGGTASTWYVCLVSWQSQAGAAGQFVLRIFITPDLELETEMGSALFPNKFAAVAQLRRDTLMVAAQNHGMPDLDSAYLWGKIRAAEGEIQRELRVFFQPTTVFSKAPTQAEIDALNGMPWVEDTGYDYDPGMFAGDRWGFIRTRHVPLQSVSRFRYAYPTDGGQAYDIPLEWLQMDKKYGHIQIVPMSTSVAALLNPWLMQIMSAGRLIPNMIHVTYVAGLKNAAADYPELLDAVKKLAVLKIIEESFVPQSGSISADGLSQSMSTDVSKYHDSVDRILNGANGNGGLMAAIHGIRLAVM